MADDRNNRMLRVIMTVLPLVAVAATAYAEQIEQTPSRAVPSQPAAQPDEARRQVLSELTALLAARSSTTSVPDGASERLLLRSIRRVQVEAAVVDPQSTASQHAMDHQLTITADKKDGFTGRGRISWSLGDRFGVSATFAAPLSGGGATFADADGLTKNASIATAVKFLPEKADLPTGGNECPKGHLVSD